MGNLFCKDREEREEGHGHERENRSNSAGGPQETNEEEEKAFLPSKNNKGSKRQKL